MKTTTIKILLALLLLFGSKLMVNAQAYIPMVVEGNKWELTHPLGWGQSVNSSHQIFCDTIIQGKVYKKVYSSHCNYAGAIREDLVTQKVYFFSPNAANEFMFINFLATVGDTIKMQRFNTGPNGQYSIVTAVTQEFLFGVYRRVINCGGHKLIEGIGSSITGAMPDLCPSGFIYGSIFSFSNVPVSACTRVLGVSNSKGTSSLTVYPNPAKDYLIIETENKEALSGYYSIYDLLGKEVKKGLLPEVNSRIDLKNFRSGVYVLIINVNGKEKYLKFQVQQ